MRNKISDKLYTSMCIPTNLYRSGDGDDGDDYHFSFKYYFSSFFYFLRNFSGKSSSVIASAPRLVGIEVSLSL